MAQADLSVIVPALGDEPALRQTLADIEFTLTSAGVSHEILVVTEPGYGRAVRRGIKVSSGKWFTIMAADGSDSPTDLIRMWRQRSSAVIAVFGERTSWVGYHPGKYLLNRLGNWAAGIVAGDRSYHDWTNPFKLYRTDYGVQAALTARASGMSFGMDLAVRIGRRCRFEVIPISWTADRSGKKSNLGLRSVVGYAMTLLRLGVERLRGRI